RGLHDKQFARNRKKFFERQHEVLAMIDETEREGNVELANGKRIEIVNRHPTVLNVEPQRCPHEDGLADQATLRINSENARGSAAFHLDGIEPRIATYVQNAFPGQILRQTNSHCFPGGTRMLNRFADGALSFGNQTVAKLNAV